MEELRSFFNQTCCTLILVATTTHLRRRLWRGLSKVRRPTFIAGGEQGDEYQKVLIFIAQVYRPTTWVFFYVGKDVKIKYSSSNFCLYLYHTKTFLCFQNCLPYEKNCAKAKYLEREVNFKNLEHFIAISVYEVQIYICMYFEAYKRLFSHSRKMSFIQIKLSFVQISPYFYSKVLKMC